MCKMGLKGSIEDGQFIDRLKYKPDILEFHLNEEDLFGMGREDLEHKIRVCQSRGIEVYLHHPINYNGENQHILSLSQERRLFYELSTRIMIDICNEYDIKCVIHAHYRSGRRMSNTELREEIEKYQSIANGRLLWENSVIGSFTTSNDRLFEEVIKPLNLRLCFDISHSFISGKGSNAHLIDFLNVFNDNIDYFHVVDSKGLSHDSLELGEGLIDFKSVKGIIGDRPYIYEIGLKNQEDGFPMVRSHKYFENL